MAAMTPADRARRLLDEQIRQLGELRNAHTRDPRFKQWRQATLTVIQRIWPGDALKSERFRRVPFSTPSSKASAQVVRETYERGCAEAANCLRVFLAEIDNTGVPMPSPARKATPGRLEDADYPVVELPAHPSAAPAPAPTATTPVAAAAPPETATTVAATTVAAADPPAAAHPVDTVGPESLAAAPPAIPVGPAVPHVFSVAAPAPPPPAGRPGTTRAGRPARRPPKPALKEMLGFSDDPHAEPLGHVEAPSIAAAAPPPPPEFMAPPETIAASTTPAAPTRPQAVPERLTQDEVEMVDALELGDEVDPSSATPPEFLAPPPAADDDRRPTQEEAAQATAEFLRTSPVLGARPKAPVGPPPETLPSHQEAAAATEEFLRSSPVLKARAKPVKRERPAEVRPPSPIAATLEALASEVAGLGVPEGQRAGARAALLDLARQIDGQNLDWDGLRRAFGFVMEYPGLARRVVPLLIPYLDSAA